MQNLPQTRVQTRALTATAVVAALTGLALGGSYLAGAQAHPGAFHALATPPALRQTALISPAVTPANPLLVKASLIAALKPAAPFHAQGAGDVDCLTQAVYYEARGESAAGQAAVAQVVLNRTRHPAFPHSVCGVVFQRAAGACQFSFACDGSMRERRDGGAWARAHAVAARALAGYVMPDVGSATNFHTTAVNPGWRGTMMRVAQVGAHIFYRFGGRFIAPPANDFGRRPDAAAPDTAVAKLDPTAAPIDPTVTADGHPAIILATLTGTPAPATVPGGMGGPLGKPVEPASAPAAKVEVKAPAKPAADAKVQGAAPKPATTLASAS